MANKRKKFSPYEKVRLLRLHLIEKVPVSDVCDQHGLNPNVFYRWQQQFFENGSAAFEKTGKARTDIVSKCLFYQVSDKSRLANTNRLQKVNLNRHRKISYFNNIPYFLLYV